MNIGAVGKQESRAASRRGYKRQTSPPSEGMSRNQPVHVEYERVDEHKRLLLPPSMMTHAHYMATVRMRTTHKSTARRTHRPLLFGAKIEIEEVHHRVR